MGPKWMVTAAAANYRVDQNYINAITHKREQEQQQMQEYMQHKGCLMKFLQRSLDDPELQDCGNCKNCNPDLFPSEKGDNNLLQNAGTFLRRSFQIIEPRKQWPANNPLPTYGFTGRINDSYIASEGRALSLWRDAGWGQLVYKGKYEDHHFSDELVSACLELLNKWNPEPAPKWVTCIPSRNYPNLVPNFAERFAQAIQLPFVSCIEKIKDTKQQKEMENSFQQARNLDGAFRVNLPPKKYAPCLLIDDIVDSRWTFSVVSALLRNAGCKAVYPLALAINTLRMD
jgi:ATP-dependent DNA helicase RecQ